MRSPAPQVRKGQPRPAQLFIQPDTEVMQSDLRSQAHPKTAEVMGPLPVQTKGMRQLLIDRLDDLAHPSQPTPQELGPWCLARALGRADGLRAIAPPPRRMILLPLKTFVDHIRP